MCMYYEDYFVAREDIYCYLVFKKRRLNIFGKITIRRRNRYRPQEGKRIFKKIEFKSNTTSVSKGIFSYVSWCPIENNDLEVWLCKIPKHSLVLRNSWEYVSNYLEFICYA